MRNELFCEVKIISTEYSTRPSAQINYHRLIKGLPAFVHCTMAEQRRMKKLVISYPIDLLNFLDRLTFAYQLVELNKEGFDIYFSHETGLLPYKKSIDLRDEMCFLIKDLRHDISEVSQHSERFYAEQLECTGDDIYIFDQFKIEKFLQERRENWQDYNHLKDGELNLTACPLNIQQFLRLMHENKDKIQKLTLNHCRFLIEPIKLTPIFSEIFPQLEEIEIHDNGLSDISSSCSGDVLSFKLMLEIIQQSPQLKKVKFDSTMEKLIENHENNKNLIEVLLKKTWIQEIQFPVFKSSIKLINSTDFRLEHLVVFDCHGLMVDEEILRRLCASQRLKFLNIHMNEFIDTSLAFSKNLDVLDLSNSLINSAGILQLLRNASNLKTLKLRDCRNIDDEILDISLTHLEELDLSGTKISSQGLIQLLANNPKLKKLELKYCCSNIDDTFIGMTLRHLEELDLLGTKISSQGLIQLLANAPQLKILKFSGFDNMSDAITANLALPNLEKLCVHESSMSAETLGQLLAKAPKLKLLQLNDCCNLSDAITANIVLPNLEKLIIFNSNITAENLGQLLVNATQLNTLVLEYCDFRRSEIKNIINLPNLTDLNLEYSQISIRVFSQLLAHAPQIKKLASRIEYFFYADDTHEIIEMPYFEKLDFMDLDIGSQGFEQLLLNVSHLKSLKLSHCKNIGEDITADITLPNLEIFDLSETNISSQGLEKILLNAKRLKTLKLIQCKNIVDEITADITLPNLEILNIYKTRISSQGLGKILAYALTLKTLELRHCQNIGDEITADIYLPNLEVLDLSFSNISSQGLGKLLANASDLKSLKLTSCGNIGDEIPGKITLPYLEILDLSFSNISSQSIAGLLASTLKLKKLKLVQFENIRDEVIGHPIILSIEEFGLSKSKISLKELGDLVGSATKLIKLELSYCAITDEISEEIDLSILEELDLSNSVFSLQALEALLVSAPQLNQLRLYQCPSIPRIFQNYYQGAIAIHQLMDALTSYIPEAQEISTTQASADQFHVEKQDSHHENHFHDNFSKKKSALIDTDTSLKNQTFKVKTEFKFKKDGQLQDIAPNQVRHECYDQLELIDGSTPFVISSERTDDEHIRAVSISQNYKSFLSAIEKASDGVYMGCFELDLTHQWKALPSVMPHEILQSFFVNARAKVDVGYSDYKNLYYIRLLESERKDSVKAVVEVILLPSLQMPDLSSLPSPIKDLIKSFDAYTPKDLPDTAGMSGEKIIQTMIQAKTGACRHRAVAFKYQMKSIAPKIPIRIITNDCHAYVEILYDKQWIQIDLGGYPGELQYQNDLFEKRKNLSAKQKPQPVQLKSINYFFSKPKQQLDELQILATDAKTILIETNDVATMRLELQTTCRSTSRSFYFIDHPDELRCLGPFIHRNEDMTGYIIDKPGGALYDYLTTESQPILILNLSRFKTSDFVRYNSLFDEEPRIEGLAILSCCKIIGLTDINITQDASITSRFELQSEMHMRQELPKLSNTTEASGFVIECCGGLNWESRLVGSWVLDGQRLTYKKGLIWEAIEHGEIALVFNNAPLEDPNFIRLMHDMTFYQGLFHQGEMLVSAPSPISLSYVNYRLILEQERYLDFIDTLEEKHVLNPDSLEEFIGKYDYQAKSHLIRLKKGLIEESAGKSLSVYLTASLTFSQWQLLMDNCRIHQTKLNVVLAPSVVLPEEIKVEGELPRLQLPEVEHSLCINQKPIDLKSTIYIDISDLTPDDLLPSLKRIETSAPQEFQFQQIEGFLNTKLAGGKTIVLSGDWVSAKNLTHALHDYLLKRMQNVNAKGQLILVQGTQNAFPFMTETLVEGPQLEPIKISEKACFQERAKKVSDLLQQHRMVILTGPTGVGKTYFVNERYRHAHFGEEHILDWILDKNSQPVLFIDEANMSYQQWSMFEGLFQEPPGIFYQRQYYPLTENHRLIFAGNPLSYGGERQLPSLFRYHPIEVEFSPLTADELLTQLQISEDLGAVIKPMLDFIFAIETQKILLTPREILMAVQVGEAWGHIDDVAYSIFKTHVPKEKQKEFEQFKPKNPKHAEPKGLKSFVVNATNQEAIDVLTQHLLVRHRRVGGLGGVVLEGEPGVGKSQLVTQLLTEEYHLKEGRDFIRIPVSLAYEKKQKMLGEAFHQGKIAIIDEINASPMMERLLNALLEGHDLENKPAEQSGFMMIGTQNPPTYRGRVQTTLPLKHRLQTVEIKEYTDKEMQEILEYIGVPSHHAADLIVDYQRHRISLNLCFRDLLREAKHFKSEVLKQSMHQRQSMFKPGIEETKALIDEVENEPLGKMTKKFA